MSSMTKALSHFIQIFYLEHVNIVNVMPRRQKQLLPHIRNWDECSILKLLQNIKNLGGVDSSQVNTNNSCLGLIM